MPTVLSLEGIDYANHALSAQVSLDSVFNVELRFRKKLYANPRKLGVRVQLVCYEVLHLMEKWLIFGHWARIWHLIHLLRFDEYLPLVNSHMPR